MEIDTIDKRIKGLTDKLNGRGLGIPHKIECPPKGGILAYYKDIKYPIKGLPFMEIVEAIGTPKKMIMGAVLIFNHTPLKWFTPLMIIVPPFIRRKIFKEMARQFVITSDWALNRHYFNQYFTDTNKFCDSVREFYKKAMQFVDENYPTMDDHWIWGKLVHIISMIFEYDSAYRYRMQDFLTELRIADFEKKPLREMIRLFREIGFRERTLGISYQKWWKVGLIIGLMFFFNRRLYKNALIIFTSFDMEQIKFDEIDWYHVSFFSEYDFKGMSYAQRFNIRMALDNKK